MATDLAKLVVKLEAQTAEFQNRLAAAERMFKKTNRNLSTIASNAAIELAQKFAQAAQAFIGVGKAAIDAADSMNDAAQRTGISTEALSRLDYAAQQSGTSFETLSKSLGKFAKNQFAAASGSKDAQAAFNKIGVAVKNADGSLRATDSILLDVADKFSRMQDGAAKAALAQELFGKTGAELIPFLNQGRAGIEALTKEADKLGLTISTKTGKDADQFNDTLNKIKSAAKGVANQFVSAFLPTLNALADSFASTATSSGALDFAVAALSVTFKSFITTGVIVKSVFQQLGQIIYGVAAALVRVAHGDFKLAAQELTDAFSKARANVTNDIETIATVWKSTSAGAAEVARDQNAALRESLLFNPEAAGAAAKAAAAAALDGIKQMVQDLEQQVAVFGMGEKAVMAYRVAHGDLAEQFKAAGKDAEAYKDELIDLTGKLVSMREAGEENAQFLKSIDDAVKENIEATARKIEDDLKAMDEAAKTQTEFERRATENVQDILATGIGDIIDQGFKRGAKSALKSFADMLDKMIQQAIAANIAQKLFGSGGIGSGGGWLGGIGNIFGKVFGGSRDSGGRGRAGQAYLIGTGAQPEMFVPDSAGSFIPAMAYAGGGSRVVQNIYVQGRVDQRSARQLELEAARRQSIVRSRLG